MSSSSGSESGDDRSSDEDVEVTIASDVVVGKYTTAAEIANAVLAAVVKKCVAGELVVEICEFGDKMLTEKTANVFKKEKEMKKGIAFPTCVSVNNCVCHFSPLKSEAATLALADGDVVKVDLGAHVDGFIAVAAHTLVVGATKDQKVTGRKADVVLAAHNCLEAAIRMLRPGKHKNTEITDTLNKISETFRCKPVENMLSFQLHRNQIGNEENDDTKVIIQNPSEEQRSKIKKAEFGEHEVYAIDILVSTGEGKGRESETRTTVYKRNETVTYSLKMKASKQFFVKARSRFEPMPFSLRAFEDEKRSKMAIVECERHALMKPFKVYHERPGEFVAQFKSTVFIMPTGLIKITGLPFDASLYKSEFSIEDKTLRDLIMAPLKPKKSKKKTAAAAGDKTASKPQADAAKGDPSTPAAPIPVAT